MPLPLQLLAGLVLVLAAAGPAQPPGDRPAPAPRPGERLRFSVGLGLMSGAAHIEVETRTGSGKEHLRLDATVRAGTLVATFYPFRYVHGSTVRAKDLLPLETRRNTEEKGEKAQIALRFDHGRERVYLSDGAGGRPLGQHVIQQDTHDILSGLFRMRRLPAEGSDRFTVYENGRLYHATLDGGREETIEVAAGRFPARRHVLRIDPPDERLSRPTIEVWISRDEHRLPLKLTAGTFLGDLTLELAEWSPASTDP